VKSIPKIHHRLGVLFGRELFGLLVSPITYLVFTLFFFFRAFEVQSLIEGFATGGSPSRFAYYFLASPSTQFAVVVIPPILTMRLLAEEKRSGSLELLMTAPVRDWEVVVAKWGATWLLFALLWVPSFLQILLLMQPSFLDASLPMGQLFAGYLGLFSVGSLLLAVGLFTSSLTDNVLLASLISLLAGLGLLVVPPMLAEKLGGSSFSQLSVDSSISQTLLGQFQVVRHLGSWFFRGLIDTGQLVFYASTTGLFLFLTVRSLESRKWR
jgi:ABC-2 type transport system permease protein